MLAFKDLFRDWLECWNLITKVRINQNVEVYKQSVTWLKKLKFKWERRNGSKCYYLRGKAGNDQDVETWVNIGSKMSSWSRCWNLIIWVKG